MNKPHFSDRATIFAFFCWLMLGGAVILAAQTDPNLNAKVFLSNGERLTRNTPASARSLPVLFVQGHDLYPNDTPNYQKNWQLPLDYPLLGIKLPSFQIALDHNQSTGSLLEIEPYYIFFEDQDRSINLDVADIAEAVEWILHRHDPSYDPADPNRKTCRQIAIIAYSKGTISSRKYLKELAARNLNYAPISEFIAIAPPNHGLASACNNLDSSLALWQLNNGVDDQCHSPASSACHPHANPDEYQDYMAHLNGDPDHPEEEAPGSRPDGTSTQNGILYICLYANAGRDFVGGSEKPEACDNRVLAKNLAPNAVNIEVPQILGFTQTGVHSNTVHTPEVIGKALYSVAHHKSPPPNLVFTMHSVEDRQVPEIPSGGADLIMVLDQSGSMDQQAAAGGTDKKIAVLKTAAHEFTDMLDTDSRHQIGMVKFSTTAEQAWPLSLFDPGARQALHTQINGLQPTYTTSIGAGLQKAIDELSLAADNISNKDAILLMTDGKENTAPMLAAVEGALLDRCVPVYTLGFGYNYGIDEEILENLAAATGGQSLVTSDETQFQKFFVDLLTHLTGWEVAQDPVFALLPGQSDSMPVVISTADREALFATHWSDADAAILFTLRGPDGKRYLPESPYHISNSRYAFYRIPLGQLSKEQKNGAWWLHVAASPQLPAERPVQIAVTTYVRSSFRMETSFSQTHIKTGDQPLLQVRLTENEQAVTGAEVTATWQHPSEGFGNVMHAYAQSGTNQAPQGSGKNDPLNPVQQKIASIEEKNGHPLLFQMTETLKLLDDGLNGDLKAGDGLYTYRLTNTSIPGTYQFHFKALTPAKDNSWKLSREWIRSFYNAVGIAPDFSRISTQNVAQTADGTRYRLSIDPKDRFGNFLGPGYPVTVQLQKKGQIQTGTATDLLNGSYQYDFLAQADEKDHSSLGVLIQGKPFITNLLLPAPSHWNLGAALGAATPTGNFAGRHKTGIGGLVQIGYDITPAYSLWCTAGAYNFPPSTAATGDATRIVLSVNVKYQKSNSPTLGWYVRTGPGYYFRQNANGSWGGNLGLGLRYTINPNLHLEAGPDFNRLFQVNESFIAVFGGVIWQLSR